VNYLTSDLLKVSKVIVLNRTITFVPQIGAGQFCR
jgi:hypothetical protein